MKGDTKVIEYLNKVLYNELTAICLLYTTDAADD